MTADPSETATIPPAEPPAPEPLVEEARVGGSEAARAVNLALLALSRTARAFQLYDPRNEAVGQFLEDLKAKTERAMAAAGGGLALEIRPFEIAWRGDVVYRERDRDRSLAFRLFKDGLRRLTLAPGLPWDEVLGVLEILSVRYTGVRQQEDDAVTLLAKARFGHVAVEAVEGFVPDEEVPEEDAGAAAPALGIEAPADWDLPLPPPRPGRPAAPRRLEPAACAALVAEEAPDALARNAARLVAELCDRVADPADPLDYPDVAVFFGEVRDFLLAEGAVEALLEVVEALSRVAAGDLRAGPSLVATFATDEAFRRLLQGVAARGEAPRDALLQLLARLPGDRLAQAVDLLAAEKDEGVRGTLLGVLPPLCARDPEQVLRRLAAADPATARDLLAAFAAGVPDRAADAALLLKDHPDPGVVVEVLRVLGEAPWSTAIGRAIVGVLRSSVHEPVRLAAVQMLADHGEQRAFEPLAHFVQQQAGAGLPPAVAEACGVALARLSPAAARALFLEWTRPRGVLGRLVETEASRMLGWTAVSGLGSLPGEADEAAVRAFMERCAGELRQHCVTTLVQRRRRSLQQAKR